MVLGLSIGRKGKKSKDQGGPVIRTSPSLPELHAQGIPWPENLVDLPEVKAVRAQAVESLSQAGGGAKVSFQSGRGFPFHKPFRSPATGAGAGGQQPQEGEGPGAIAAIYTANRPSSAFSRSGTYPAPGLGLSSRSQRRRIAPTFNVMVAGSQGTGKSSLLKLLLDTCEISPNATPEQRNAVDRFLQSPTRRTRSIQTACIEIAESRFDRLLLTCIDTPGLDFSEGQELSLERAVSGIVKYLDLQYADTMGEESKVIRQSKGDQHVHLCIYLIDPDSVMTPAARRAKSTLPTRTRSQTTFRYLPDDLSSLEDEPTSDSSDDEEAERLTLSPAEIRVIRRLSTRVNVLPVIALADTLIDSRLTAIKKAVRRDLSEVGLGFGVFGPALDTAVTTVEKEEEEEYESGAPPVPPLPADAGAPAAVIPESPERRSRPVIKIRPTSRVPRSRSRRRRDSDSNNTAVDGPEDEEMPVENSSDATINGTTTPAAAPKAPKVEIATLLPFAIISPESGLRRPKRKQQRQQQLAKEGDTVEGSVNGHAETLGERLADETQPGTPITPTTPRSPPSAFPAAMLPVSRRKELPKGKFVRQYRWGTIDVLDPNHCDFTALRTAVLSTHTRLLKASTKENLYERYRTEKLLARRATQNITDEDKKRLLEDLGI